MSEKFKELFQKIYAQHKDYIPFQKLQERVEALDAKGIKTSSSLVNLLRNHDTDVELRHDIISILGSIKYKPAIPTFLEIASDENEGIRLRRGSLVYLASLDSKKAYTVLSKLVTDNHADDIRMIAAEFLYFIQTKRCLNLLISVMQSDRNAIVRGNAARSIGLMTRRDKSIAVQPLLDLLGNLAERPKVRAYAAEALGFIRDEKALDSLACFTTDLSPEVRYMCAYSLGEIGSVSHLELLESLLTDTAIFDGWGTVGEAAKEAIENLRRICPV